MFVKFLGIGGIATALQYVLLAIMVELLGINAVIASTLAYVASSVANYMMNYYFTFSSTAGHRQAASKFAVVVCCGLGINAGVMFILLNVVGLHYLAAQICATLVVLICNYIAHKHWTYKHG